LKLGKKDILAKMNEEGWLLWQDKKLIFEQKRGQAIGRQHKLLHFCLIKSLSMSNNSYYR